MQKVIKNTDLEPISTDILKLDNTLDPDSYDVPTTHAVAEAVGGASDALQEQIDDIAEKAGSGYTPKGPASVATLNGLTGQENGWLYTMTDAGTLTDGSLAVVAGDTVAWDATGETWYKVNQYATADSVRKIFELGINTIQNKFYANFNNDARYIRSFSTATDYCVVETFLFAGDTIEVHYASVPPVSADKYCVVNPVTQIKYVVESLSKDTTYTATEDCVFVCTLYKTDYAKVNRNPNASIEALEKKLQDFGKYLLTRYDIDHATKLKCFYDDSKVSVGAVYSLDKTTSNNSYSVCLLALNAGDMVCVDYTSGTLGVDAKKFAVINKNTNIIESVETLTSSHAYTYTAVADCLVSFNLTGVAFALTNYSPSYSALDNSKKIDETNERVEGLVTRRFTKETSKFVGQYINNGSKNIGDLFFTNFSSASGYSVVIFVLEKGDTAAMNFVSGAAGVVANKYYVIDYDSRILEAIGDLPASGTIGTYTATKKCIFALTLTGSQYVTVTGINALSLAEDSELADKINGYGYKSKIIIPKYIDAPINTDIDIYIGNAIFNKREISLFSNFVSASTNFKNVSREHIRFKSSGTDRNVRVRSYGNSTDNSYIEKTVYLRNVSKSAGGATKNICVCGDSLIDGTYTPFEMYRLLAQDGDVTINQIGTRTNTLAGTTFRHEGRGGWSFATYLNPTYESTAYEGKTNAFMHDGALDFQHYMTTNFPDLSGIDYFFVALGTNDVNQGLSYVTENKIAEIIANAKTFIDALLSADTGFPNCKVAVGLPPLGAPCFTGNFGDGTLFESGMMKLNAAYIDNFDNGKYNANVTCVAHGLFMCRELSYPYESTTENEYLETQVVRYTNDVHPSAVGYKQLGKGLYTKARAFIDNKL